MKRNKFKLIGIVAAVAAAGFIMAACGDGANGGGGGTPTRGDNIRGQFHTNAGPGYWVQVPHSQDQDAMWALTGSHWEGNIFFNQPPVRSTDSGTGWIQLNPQVPFNWSANATQLSIWGVWNGSRFEITMSYTWASNGALQIGIPRGTGLEIMNRMIWLNENMALPPTQQGFAITGGEDTGDTFDDDFEWTLQLAQIPPQAQGMTAVWTLSNLVVDGDDVDLPDPAITLSGTGNVRTVTVLEGTLDGSVDVTVHFPGTEPLVQATVTLEWTNDGVVDSPVDEFTVNGDPVEVEGLFRLAAAGGMTFVALDDDGDPIAGIVWSRADPTVIGGGAAPTATFGQDANANQLTVTNTGWTTVTASIDGSEASFIVVWGIDVSDLIDAIAAAELISDETWTGAALPNNVDVPNDGPQAGYTYMATTAQYTPFRAAISAAGLVLNDHLSTQAQVDAAEDSLDPDGDNPATAVYTFRDVRVLIDFE